jgi:monoamine oxidase
MANDKERTTVDVAILGAGVAGLEAARVLHEHEIDFIVLEARERVGGRVFSLHDESLPVAIELGAEFVHGRAPELRDIAQEGPFAIADIDGQRWESHQGRLRRADDFWDRLDVVMGKLRTRGQDRSFEQFLKSAHRLERRARSFALQWVENFHAADPARVSERALAEGGSPGDDVRERRLGRVLGGYDAVARWIGRGIADHIRFGTVVTGVQWEEGAVRIETRQPSGTSSGLAARAVIVALPLGVLVARPGEPGAVAFDPPLARDSTKAAALEGMTMGAVARVTLRLREPFWASSRFARRAKDQNLDRLSFLHTEDRDFPVWWTSYPVSAPVLVAWRGGMRAREISAAGEDQAVELALAALARQFGLTRREARGMVTATWFHNWESDPYARGAYSYVVVGGNDASAKLARPVRRTLFFAGEASDSEGRTGTVHGAIASGRRAATQILRAL